MASIQLPVKYPELPAALIGPIETPIWHIYMARSLPLSGGVPLVAGLVGFDATGGRLGRGGWGLAATRGPL